MKNNAPSIASLLALAALLAAAGELRGQGSLTPPGAPAPTMKSLDQVEARTIVNSTTCPGDAGSKFIISQSGSYYLGANLEVGSGNGVRINAADVTLDLNGFTISSFGSAGDGIACTAGQDITVRNGHIKGTTLYSNGAFNGGGFVNGVNVTFGRNVRIEGVTVAAVQGAGINVIGQEAVISHCMVDTVGGPGINAGTAASSVDHCTAQTCADYGIQAFSVDNCTAKSVSPANFGIKATSATNSNGSTIGSGEGLHADYTTNCYGYSYSGTGLLALTATNSGGGSYSGSGLNAATAGNSYGYSSSGKGINATTALNCFSSSDTSSGLSATTATGCWAASSSAVGISATIVNNCIGYTYGTTAAAIGISAGGPVTSSVGFGNGGASYGLKVYISNCSISTGGAVSISYKYNAP